MSEEEEVEERREFFSLSLSLLRLRHSLSMTKKLSHCDFFCSTHQHASEGVGTAAVMMRKRRRKRRR